MKKVIIFDFDNTLYRGDIRRIWREWPEYCMRGLRKIFAHLDKREWDELAERYGFDKRILTGHELASLCIAERGSAEDWYNYLANEVLEIEYDEATPISNETIARFAQSHVIYIVSNSPVNVIHKYAKRLGIDLSPFKGVYSNKFLVEDESKFLLYSQIINAEKISPKDLLVVGDNYHVDIEPALKIGASGLHVPPNADLFTYEDVVNSAEYRN